MEANIIYDGKAGAMSNQKAATSFADHLELLARNREEALSLRMQLERVHARIAGSRASALTMGDCPEAQEDNPSNALTSPGFLGEAQEILLETRRYLNQTARIVEALSGLTGGLPE